MAEPAPRPTAAELIHAIGLAGLVRTATVPVTGGGDAVVFDLHPARDVPVPDRNAAGNALVHELRPPADAPVHELRPSADAPVREFYPLGDASVYGSHPTRHAQGRESHPAHDVPVREFRPGRDPRPVAPGSPSWSLGGVAAGSNAGDVAGGLGAPDRMLPVLPLLRGLLPGRGLRRGSTVATQGATSLVIALLAEASRAGSWCAVVGLPALGALAAAEAGVALDRLALVPDPGPEWTSVVAALLDGVDIVVAAPPGPVAAPVTGRLAARARQRGSVLVGIGLWPGADLVLDSVRSRWEGLDRGRGRLSRREMTVVVRGRGAASQPREARLWMPEMYPVNHAWNADRWRRLDQHPGPAFTLLDPPVEEPAAPPGSVTRVERAS